MRFKQLQATGANTVVTACPFCSIMLKGAEASAQSDTQFVDLMTYVNGKLQRSVSSPLTDAMSRPTGARRGRSACRRALISALGYPVIAALGVDVPLARRKASSISTRVRRSGRQPIMAFWHGRILPATYYFRRRGIVVITSENFDGEWIAGIIERFGYGTARGSTSRGAVKALVQLKRDMAAGKPAGVHARRPARSGAGRAAGRGLAGQGDRQSDPAVPPRGRSPLDR